MQPLSNHYDIYSMTAPDTQTTKYGIYVEQRLIITAADIHRRRKLLQLRKTNAHAIDNNNSQLQTAQGRLGQESRRAMLGKA